MNSDEDVFYQLTVNLKSIDQGEQETEGRLQQQADQFVDLTRMEEDFRSALILHPQGRDVYAAFCNHFAAKTHLEEVDKEGKPGLLASRPYFRERQKACAGIIGDSIRDRDFQELQKYHINYNFIRFAMALTIWSPGSEIGRLASGVRRLRETIISQNIPLAISQARLFWRKAPVKMRDKRFSAMDFIQVAIEGLMSAVDKFCLPPGSVDPAKIRTWRSVAIGRMRGNFIELFSSTTVHFFPPDRKKIYRANKQLRHFDPSNVDYERLAWIINPDLGKDQTTGEELASLMGASAWVGDPREGTFFEKREVKTVTEAAAADDQWQPDLAYEQQEVRHRVKEVIAGLDILDRKILFLRGVDPEQI